MVKRQQVEEFVKRLIFPISQAAVSVSDQSSSYTNYFSKFYLRGSLGDCSIQVNDNTNWDSVKSDRNRLLEADITVIDGKQIREFNNRPLNKGRQLYTVMLNRGSNVYPLRWFLRHNYIVELPPGVFNNNINLTQLTSRGRLRQISKTGKNLRNCYN